MGKIYYIGGERPRRKYEDGLYGRWVIKMDCG
jgi:hypothetical protein